MFDKEIFGERIRMLREEKKVSQKELAEYLNVGKSAVSMLECGERAPSAETMIDLADYFGVSLDYLTGRCDKKTYAPIKGKRNTKSIIQEENCPVKGELTKDFSIILRQLRKEKNLSQRALGEVVGITERSIRYYESGRNRPDFDGLLVLAEYFDVSIDYLVGRSEDPTRY